MCEKTNTSILYILEIKILSARLGCALEKLKVEENLLFRFLFEIKKDKGIIGDKKKSKKVVLTDSLMSFDEDFLIFSNVERTESLEITMATGTSDRARKFKSDIIYFKDLNLGYEQQTSWLLTSNSVINVKYKLYEVVRNIEKKNSMNSNSAVNDNKRLSLPTSKTEIIESPKKASTELSKDTSVKLFNFDECINTYTNFSDNKECGSPSKKIIIEKRNTDIKSLISIFEQPQKAKRLSDVRDSNISLLSNLTSRASASTATSTVNNNPILSLISSRPSTQSTLSRDSLIVTTHLPFETRKSSNISNEIDLSGNNKNKDSYINRISKMTLKKEKFRKEQSVIYQDFNDNSPSVDKLSPDLKISNLESPLSNATIISSEEYLIPENEKNFVESFCEAFFIAGLPSENPSIITGGEEYISQCRHVNCSMLLSYKGEILSRYPVKDNSRLELNSLVASLCFPLGIKVCYSQEESKIKTVKNYSTAIINQDGSRYYMMTYHFFVRYDKSDFDKTFKINPIKELLNLNVERVLYENNQSLKEKYEKNLINLQDVSTDLNYSDFINVPYCACMISKNPYTRQMEICIQSLLLQMVDTKSVESNIYKQILYLTREIPIPPTNKKLLFSLTNYSNSIEIIAPIYKDLPIFNDNLRNLLQLFSIENIVIIHHLMLLEQKILFVGDEYCQLSDVIESFTCLLYPMKWVHTYIPILSEELIKYLQSFMPFIMGIDESLLHHARPYFAEESSIFIVYIKKDLIDISSNDKGKKLKKKELLQIPEYPNELEKWVIKKLTELKKVIDKNKGKQEVNNTGIEICIRDIFVRAFVRLFGDYSKYNAVIEDVPIFNTESFIETRPEMDKLFYSELTETQIFRNFLQFDARDNFPYFYQQIEKYKNIFCPANITKTRRSNSIISGRRTSIVKSLNDDNEIDYKQLILNTKLSNENKNFNARNSAFSIMTLSTLPSMDLSQNCSSLLEQINSYDIAETFAIPEYLEGQENSLKNNKFSAILSENNRIFYRIKILDLNLIPKNYNRYIIPELKEKELQLLRRGSGIPNISISSGGVIINVSNKIQNTSKIFEQRVIEQSKKNKIFIKGGIQNKSQSQQLTPQEQEDIKFEMNECLRMIFTSQKLNIEQKKNLDLYFKKPFGLEHFSKGIFQSKFKENQDHCLSKESFEDLFQLLFGCLLVIEREQTKQNFKHTRLLTKSTFKYYRTDINNSNYYIFQELNNKKGSFSVWKNEKFWNEWIEIEKNERILDGKLIEQDDIYFKLLIDISEIMISIKLECKFILVCVVDVLGKKYIKNTSLLNDLNLAILKQAKNIIELNY